jgi:predicted transcriptional regulator
LLLQQMKSASQSDKILQLNVAGFSNVEIANILETTPAVVSQTIYSLRRSSPSKKKKVKKKKSPKVKKTRKK